MCKNRNIKLHECLTWSIFTCNYLFLLWCNPKVLLHVDGVSASLEGLIQTTDLLFHFPSHPLLIKRNNEPFLAKGNYRGRRWSWTLRWRPQARYSVTCLSLSQIKVKLCFFPLFFLSFILSFFYSFFLSSLCVIRIIYPF